MLLPLLFKKCPVRNNYIAALFTELNNPEGPAGVDYFFGHLLATQTEL